MSPTGASSRLGDERSTHEWRARADQFAPLIDGAEYFASVRSSIIAARSQILIVGWDLHSEVALLRGERADSASEQDGYPVTLADLLQRIVEERDALHVYLLIWIGASLFALEREHFPRMKRPWEQHPRIRLEWAKDTPVLGSHHQKLVVIDDRVVFAGGMDLTKSRWDTHSHRVEDTRRRKPGLIPSFSKPYHDTMGVFEGEIARTLGDFARERWMRTTSQRLDPPESESDPESPTPWPRDIKPLLRDRDVFIALTQPDHGSLPEKRQIEASFLEQFFAAKRLIYIETQYFSAEPLADVLARRLREPGGPEIVIVLPYGCPGILQSMALDHQRDRLIHALREADPGGRLGIYWPTLSGGNVEQPYETSVYVHAKVAIVDDRILRIGSANLNNRSMGLDTELDTWIESTDGEHEVHEAIARFRRRSIGYLLGCSADSLADAERDQGSLVSAIESLRGGDRTLYPFEHEAPEYSRAAPLDIRLADPDRPLSELDAERVLKVIAEQTGLSRRARRARAVAIGLARRNKGWLIACASLLIVGAIVWLTPLGQPIASIDTEATMRVVRDSQLRILGVIFAVVVLGSIGFPITALVVAAGAVIGAWWSAPIAVLSVLAASAPGFALGRLAPDSVTRALTSGQLGDSTKAFQNNAVLAVAALRNLPVAPFAVVNTALGATGLPWAPYLLGTAIGMLPGVVLLSLFGQRLVNAVSNPTAIGIATLAGIVLSIVVASVAAQRALNNFAPDDVSSSHRDS